LNQDDADSFNQVTSRMVEVTAQLDRAKQKFQGINGVLEDAGNQLVNVFDQAVIKGQSFQQVMVGVLQAVEKQMLIAAVTGQGSLGKLFGTAGQNGNVGGLMGMFSGLFGGAHASGGDIDPGKVSLVGERGPELIVPKSTMSVIPNGKLAIGGGGGFASQQNNAIHVNITNTGPANHQDNQKMAEQVGRHVQDALDAHFAKNLRNQTRPGGVLFGARPGTMGR
jgi:phage-related minor tail protein